MTPLLRRALLPLALAACSLASAAPADLRDKAWADEQSATAVVHFAPGSSELSPSARQTLHALAVEARSRPGAIALVSLTGHADRAGEGEANDFLASDRAIAVGAFLDAELDFQVGETDQVYDAKSESDQSPALGCASSPKARSAECLAADRRAEVEITFWRR